MDKGKSALCEDRPQADCVSREGEDFVEMGSVGGRRSGKGCMDVAGEGLGCFAKGTKHMVAFSVRLVECSGQRRSTRKKW